ncbi:MAG: hypothetical protein RJA19_364 [Bacteroidota bacterium]
MNFRLLSLLVVPLALLAVQCTSPEPHIAVPRGTPDALIPLPAELHADPLAPALRVSKGWRWDVDSAWASELEFWQRWLPAGGGPTDTASPLGPTDTALTPGATRTSPTDKSANSESGAPLRMVRVEGLAYEAYRLGIDSATGVRIEATTAAGAFRALTTLRQLIPAACESGALIPVDVPGPPCPHGFEVPAVQIEDRPAYDHRGLLLDCARHFMEPEFVKRTIDLLAQHKMNVLHWHLTEDQGWRLAIEAYPQLTEVGAWRQNADGTRHGGFYTREQVKDIVAYAAQRHITVIPEIELPGHSRAALAAYPWLGCTGDSLPVEHRWGVFKDIYCPGQDTTFAFLRTVMEEVVGLFPSAYIHIGGDEAPKVRWEDCARCQTRIRQMGLPDEQALQSWMIGEVAADLARHGRKIIGWDEIHEGGLPPGATVQSWRGTEGGWSAMAQGHDAIFSPTSHCYLDYPLSSTDLEEVYGWDLLEGAPADYQPGAPGWGRLLGGEGNMWSEHAPQHLVESKIYPRLIALAEVLWSPAELRNWEDFQRRLDVHYERLDAWKVDYGLEAVPAQLELSAVPGSPPSDSAADSAAPGPHLTRARVLPATRGISGSAAFAPADGGASTPAVDLGVPFDFRGKGEISTQLEHRARVMDHAVTFPVAGHQATFLPLVIGHALNPSYPGGGMQGLADGRLGSADFRDGCWQAVQGGDLSAEYFFERPLRVDSLAVQTYFYQDAWIFPPSELVFSWTADGKRWQSTTLRPGPRKPDAFQGVQWHAVPVGEVVTGVRLRLKNGGPCPAWHDAASEPTWIFADEFMVW